MKIYFLALFILLTTSSLFAQRLTNSRLYYLGDAFVIRLENYGSRLAGYINQGRYRISGTTNTLRLPNYFHLNSNLDSLGYVVPDSGALGIYFSVQPLTNDKLLIVGAKFPQPLAYHLRMDPVLAIYDITMRNKIREVTFPGRLTESTFGTAYTYMSEPNKIWIYGCMRDTATGWDVPFVRLTDTLLNLSPISKYIDTGYFSCSKIIKRGPNEYWLLGAQSYDTYTPGRNRFMAHGNKYVLDSNGRFLRKEIFDVQDLRRGMRYSVKGATGLSLDYYPMPDRSFLVKGSMFSNPNYPGLSNDSLHFLAKLDSNLRFTNWVKIAGGDGNFFVLDDNTYISAGQAPWNPNAPNTIEIYRFNGTSGAQLSSYSVTPVFNNLRPFPVYIAPYHYSFIGDSTILCMGVPIDRRNFPGTELWYTTGAFTIKGIPNHYNPVGLERKDQGSVKAVVRAYPNPFQGSFMVAPESPALYQQQGYIQLVNMKGQVVYEGPYQLGHELVVPNLPRGLYMYQFTSASGVCKGRVLRE